MHSTLKKILEFNKPLLPEMVEVKYGLMSRNMYNYYRGTCHLFYEDLAKQKNMPSSPPVWITGDLHLENFGSYKGDNRLVYFDLNDFDEAVLAPCSWELTRFITSIFIAFETIGIEEVKAVKMARLFLKVYAATLANGKSYYLEPKTVKGIVKTFLSKASSRKHKKLLSKKTQKNGGSRSLRITTKHRVLDKTLQRDLHAHINNWIENRSNSLYNYEVLDSTFRVAGLGSLGLKRYLFLLRSTNVEEKYLLVDMKQSRTSSLQSFVNMRQPAWDMESQRISEIQKRMQNIPPALLSTSIFKEEHYVIQEMQSVKEAIKLDVIKHRYRDIYQVINDMAILTASAHLRSSGRQRSATADELMQFGLTDQWQQKIFSYSYKYAKKVKSNYNHFKEWFHNR